MLIALIIKLIILIINKIATIQDKYNSKEYKF